MVQGWQEPVFDRTQADVDYAKAQLKQRINSVALKGCLNWEDLNRIEINIEGLANELSNLYYFADVLAYTTWNDSDIPRMPDIIRITDNIRTLWEKFYKPPDSVDLPDTLLTFEQVNAIEKNLYLIKELLDDMTNSFGECGVLTCGEEE